MALQRSGTPLLVDNSNWVIVVGLLDLLLRVIDTYGIEPSVEAQLDDIPVNCNSRYINAVD